MGEGFELNVNGIEPGKKVELLWECVDHTNPNYKASVIRTSPYNGLLAVAFKGHVFCTKKVDVMYDALYGADFSDQDTWGQLAEEITEAHELMLKGEHP